MKWWKKLWEQPRHPLVDVRRTTFWFLTRDGDYLTREVTGWTFWSNFMHAAHVNTAEDTVRAWMRERGFLQIGEVNYNISDITRWGVVSDQPHWVEPL